MRRAHERRETQGRFILNAVSPAWRFSHGCTSAAPPVGRPPGQRIERVLERSGDQATGAGTRNVGRHPYRSAERADAIRPFGSFRPSTDRMLATCACRWNSLPTIKVTNPAPGSARRMPHLFGSGAGPAGFVVSVAVAGGKPRVSSLALAKTSGGNTQPPFNLRAAP